MTVSPVVVTGDLPRLQAFYVGLTGATVTATFPPEGPVFYVGLSIGLGLVSDGAAGTGPGGRVLLDVGVPSVDDALALVEELGGTVKGPANDMPWGQRVAHVTDPDGNDVNLTQELVTTNAPQEESA